MNPTRELRALLPTAAMPDRARVPTRPETSLAGAALTAAMDRGREAARHRAAKGRPRRPAPHFSTEASPLTLCLMISRHRIKGNPSEDSR